jgi:uncharacterized GH25 family protein
MKRFFLPALLLFLTFYITAHEFWLQPGKFIFRPGENVRIKFLAGENFVGENWDGNRQNVQKLRLYYEEIEDELDEYITDSTSGDSLNLQFFDEGTAMVTFNSANKFVEMDAEKFMAYLKEDSLDDVIEYRKVHHESDSSGKEFYQRSVKTIFQIGSAKDDTYNIDTDLPIDIIPLNHPYTLKKNELLTLRVQFNKVPLKEAQVKVWHKQKGKTVKKQYTTDENGIVSFPVNTSGQWMVSTVKMVRIPSNEQINLADSSQVKAGQILADSLKKSDSLQQADPSKSALNIQPRAQWQSYRGSLTWGYTK